jgi:hypothetical protein
VQVFPQSLCANLIIICSLLPSHYASEILFLHWDDISPENVSQLVPYTLILTGQATYNHQCRKDMMQIRVKRMWHGICTDYIYIYIYMCVCVCVCVCMFLCVYTYNVYALFRENMYDFLIKIKEVECIKIP